MELSGNVQIIPAFKDNPRLRKVGIYARVSTARVEQMRSLAAQVSALTQYVYQRNDMLLRDTYIDVGSAKTGSSRQEFTRLLQDCESGKINYVIVKSMSRFGRDAMESTEALRLLREAGVPVYFMMEDREIARNTAEFDETVTAAIIQSENEHRSENIKMGLKHKAELGTSGLYSKPCYGYVKDGSGKLVPDVYQEAVVRHIYELYLAGKSETAIIENLASKRILTAQGKDRWSKKAVQTILTNEKYTGNVVILKSGSSRASYRKSAAHEPIISREMFDKVQEERSRRARRKPKDYASIARIASEKHGK